MSLADEPVRHLYYSANFPTMDKFLRINPPCSECIVCATCLNFNVRLRKNYYVMVVKKPCERFDEFLEGNEYGKIIYKFKVDYYRTSYGYIQNFWGERI